MNIVDYVSAMNDMKECTDWYLEKEMDKIGFDYSGFCCLKLAKHISESYSDNGKLIYSRPDVILRKWDNGSFGIPRHDGGTSMIEIYYCPLCGTKLNNDE